MNRISVGLIVLVSLVAVDSYGQSASSGSQSDSTPAPQTNPFGKFFSDIKNKVTQDLSKGNASSPTLPTQLEHRFAHGVFDKSQPLSTQFPRIAFTVLESPGNHSFVTAGSNGSLYPKGCWKLSAVIWTGPQTSESIPPFDACMPGLLVAANGVPLLPYQDWWGVKGELYRIPADQSTGSQRTDGPTPPDTPFPQGPRYAAYFRSATSQAGPAVYSFESDFWAVVLFHMDFDPAQYKDRRIWVTKFVPVEGN